MNDALHKKPSTLSLFRNWISLTGLLVAVASFFGFFLLFMLDSLAPFSNPYMGLLTYFVAPAFLIAGILLAIVGAWIERRALAHAAPGHMPALQIDLSQPRHRRLMGLFVAVGVVFLLATAIGSYRSYHFTESVQFCGLTCHAVMKPEYVTYLHSPHAKVECSACHVGPGAQAFMRAKLQGTHQLLGVMKGNYPKPVPAPVKNMREAKDTCLGCHWEKRYIGILDRNYTHFLADKENTPYTVRLLLNVGGSDPDHGPVGGIHYHMNVARKIEFIVTDEQRQVIPWVRMTEADGKVTEYRAEDFKGDPNQYPIRRMDCLDCHNRIGHQLRAPDAAVDLAMSVGKIDPSLPFIKKNAVAALAKTYATEQEAAQKIATMLTEQYPNEPRIKPVIAAVQDIYQRNIFPSMKASWKAYPDNVGHKDSAGCFRCHDNKHASTTDKKKIIQANDCKACHLIFAQGKGAELQKTSATGLPFAHPGGDFGDAKCSDCHTGGPM
jgi:nitrate/TMAO reductase-like tetraheme cytochrome c subunit